MTSSNMAADGVCKQNGGAIGPANPEALATSIADETVGIRPGRTDGVSSIENSVAVNLLGAMDTDSC
jgi:hypothetical protein